jgi:hypothetical protein
VRATRSRASSARHGDAERHHGDVVVETVPQTVEERGDRLDRGGGAGGRTRPVAARPSDVDEAVEPV